MPYVYTINNRFVGQHDCHTHHYGDQTLVRGCCVADAKRWKETAERVALSDAHPSVGMFTAAWNALTDAERSIVGELAHISPWEG